MHSEPIEYNPNLQIDPGTKKLILRLLDSLLSVVPVERKPEPDTTAQEAAPVNGKDVYIEKVLLNAHANAELLNGIFDPSELERYYRYLKDYREISGKVAELHAAVNDYRDAAFRFSAGLAKVLQEHLEMVSPSFRSAFDADDPIIENQPRLRVV